MARHYERTLDASVVQQRMQFSNKRFCIAWTVAGLAPSVSGAVISANSRYLRELRLNLSPRRPWCAGGGLHYYHRPRQLNGRFQENDEHPDVMRSPDRPHLQELVGSPSRIRSKQSYSARAPRVVPFSKRLNLAHYVESKASQRPFPARTLKNNTRTVSADA